MKARLQIRETVYRRVQGFLICGRERDGRKVSIFCETREIAVRIRAKVAMGQELTVADFAA